MTYLELHKPVDGMADQSLDLLQLPVMVLNEKETMLTDRNTRTMFCRKPCY